MKDPLQWKAQKKHYTQYKQDKHHSPFQKAAATWERIASICLPSSHNTCTMFYT